MVNRILNFIKKGDMAEDPVCHMRVRSNDPPGGSHEYSGTMYYFCGPGCRVAFAKEPDAYLTGEKRIEM